MCQETDGPDLRFENCHVSVIRWLISMVWTDPRVNNWMAKIYGLNRSTCPQSNGWVFMPYDENGTELAQIRRLQWHGSYRLERDTWNRLLWSLLWWSFAKPAEHLPGRIAQGQPYFRQFAIPSLQCNRQTRNLRVIALNPVFPLTLEPATLSSALRWIRASSLMFSQQARERSVETAGLLLWFCKSSEIT